ncbi:CHAT domain-containing protein [Haladaptatus salinisoli]|uniref:CHAT domain-containing protein n=1 Tax=Haladaptatus salinisoli TaxID=2884876 RepID=UPI001D0B66D0|nr:CHAT domain-containing protein [Haladaptatus salinisoli]
MERFDLNADELSVAPNEYYLQVSPTPINLYLGVESAVRVNRDDETTVIEFDDEQTVRLGARSLHTRPAGTITVTGDVEDAMRAVSLFGSALKTTSPERAYPTLRGHPPAIERGEEFSAPKELEPPNTNVHLALPPKREYVYPAASLAHYLGATLVPGTEPALVGDGFEYSLTGSNGYESTVGRVLRQVWFLDCVVRTEGYYPITLHERDAIEPSVDLDFAALYDAPLSERLGTYLDVPFETLEPHVPEWHLTTDVVPTSTNVDVLPFVANDLALIRCPSRVNDATIDAPPRTLTEFCRDAVAESGDDESKPPIVEPEPVESAEHAWIGDGYPMGSNKVTVESLRRRVEFDPTDDPTVRIRVICNDASMREEGRVEELYGFRDMIDYDVELAYDLTTDELREQLATPTDFLHYVGHVDHRGIRCADGVLDARRLDAVNVQTFLLNACRSYEQGAALVEKGSHTGVVTLSEVSNQVATRVGRTLARLLNTGFPFRVALSIARGQTLAGYQYITIGDGGTTLCQSRSGGCSYFRLRRVDEETFRVRQEWYVDHHLGMGSTIGINVDSVTKQYLGPGTIESFELTEDELDAYFDLEAAPVEYEGDLYWSDDISAADLD